MPYLNMGSAFADLPHVLLEETELLLRVDLPAAFPEELSKIG